METKELINKLPKADLHLHLDGSIRLSTIIELAKEQKIELPSYTVSGLEETVFKDNYENLGEYLKTFGYSCSVLQTPEAVARVSYEIAIDCLQESVYYIEVRMDPLLITNSKQSSQEVIKNIDAGLAKAKQEHNNKAAVKTGKEPHFHYAIIICALRYLGPWSDYYSKLFANFPSLSTKQITQLAALEQVKGAIKAKESGLPVVAFDLAGAEADNPCIDFVKSFQIAHQHFLHNIVHAGEASGVESILTAVQFLYAERIGHGFFLFESENYSIEQKEMVDWLIKHLQKQTVTIEVCLTSNLQTLPQLNNKITEHSYLKMLDKDLKVVINTDNRTCSKTSVTKELLLAREGLANSGAKFSAERFKQLVLNPFESSFFHGKHQEKKQFIQECSTYYDTIAKGNDLSV